MAVLQPINPSASEILSLPDSAGSTNVAPRQGGGEAAFRDSDVALKRYDAVFRYLAYENSSYWTRAQFFLLANTAFAAFVLNQMPLGPTPPTWNRCGILAFASGIGLTLTWIWREALKSTERWIWRWEDVLRDLEAEAFGEIKLLRETRNSRHHSAKKSAHWLAVLFATVWLLSLCYIVVISLAKAYNAYPTFQD